MAFFVGPPAWHYCVRKKDHRDGECIMDLSGLERERLGELPSAISKIEAQIEDLKQERLGLVCEQQRLEAQARRAEFMRNQ